MAVPVQRILLCFAVLSAATHANAAQAVEWRYCLASSAQHKVYMSAPFPNDMPMEMIEAAFGRALDHALKQHDAVQCPRGDKDSIAMMKSQAIQYSRARGAKVIEFNWRP